MKTRNIYITFQEKAPKIGEKAMGSTAFSKGESYKVAKVLSDWSFILQEEKNGQLWEVAKHMGRWISKHKQGWMHCIDLVKVKAPK